MERKKNIEDRARVSIRVRPLNAVEASIDDRCCYVASKGNMIEIDHKFPRNESTYHYDEVYGEDATTQDVYNGTVKDIVKNLIRKGLNGTVIAYGQTNSGKTFTIQGYNGEKGIVHLAAKEIFTQISETPDRDFLVRVSFIEIYNEQIRDLLAGRGNKKNLNVYNGTSRGAYVDSKYCVATGTDNLMNIHRKGDKNRTVGSTKMNKHSSRSHSIFRIMVESRDTSVDDDTPGNVVSSELTLVDLAGSECAKDTKARGKRQEEASKTNRSILSLSKVIKSLATPVGNVNYRESKLTQVLRTSLQGNAMIAFICCITPSRSQAAESLNTLKFASRAKLVRTNATPNSVMVNKSLIQTIKRKLEEEKSKLKELEQKEKITSKSENERKAQAEKVELYESYILSGRRTSLRWKPIQTIKAVPVSNSPFSQSGGLSVINVEGYHEGGINQKIRSNRDMQYMGKSDSNSIEKDSNETKDDQSAEYQQKIESLRDQLRIKELAVNKLRDALEAERDKVSELEDEISVFEEKAIACENMKCNCSIQ